MLGFGDFLKKRRQPYIQKKAESIDFALIPQVVRDLELAVKNGDPEGILQNSYPDWTMADLTELLKILNNRMRNHIDANSDVLKPNQPLTWDQLMVHMNTQLPKQKRQ